MLWKVKRTLKVFINSRRKIASLLSDVCILRHLMYVIFLPFLLNVHIVTVNKVKLGNVLKCIRIRLSQKMFTYSFKTTDNWFRYIYSMMISIDQFIHWKGGQTIYDVNWEMESTINIYYNMQNNSKSTFYILHFLIDWPCKNSTKWHCLSLLIWKLQYLWVY